MSSLVTPCSDITVLHDAYIKVMNKLAMLQSSFTSSSHRRVHSLSTIHFGQRSKWFFFQYGHTLEFLSWGYFKGLSSGRSRITTYLSLGLLFMASAVLYVFPLLWLQVASGVTVTSKQQFMLREDCGIQCWFLCSIWNKFSRHCSSFLSSSVPLEDTARWRIKQKIWWRSGMKRPVVTGKGRAWDSNWGEGKTQSLKAKSTGVCQCLSLGCVKMHPDNPFITVYLGIRIVWKGNHEVEYISILPAAQISKLNEASSSSS